MSKPGPASLLATELRDASAAQQGQYVQANGINIYFEQSGSGEPLVLIHAGALNLNSWEKHIPIFAQHYTVIAPDSRGHGRTKNPLDTMSYRMLADDMAAFIRALGLDRPLFCGYSDGGQIGLEMGMHYPQLAKAYVIGAADFKWNEAYFKAIERLGMESPGSVNFEQLERDSPEFVQRLRESHDVFQGEDYWKTYMVQLSKMWLAPLNYSPGELLKIGEPCLILVGDRDDFVLPAEQAVALYRMIPRAELAIVPGSDHGFRGRRRSCSHNSFWTFYCAKGLEPKQGKAKWALQPHRHANEAVAARSARRLTN